MRACSARLCSVAVFFVLCRPVCGDTIVLKNGDRLTGKTAEIDDKIGIQTDYGYILLKKDAIAKIEKAPVKETGPAIDADLYKRLVSVALDTKRSYGIRSSAMQQLGALNAKKAIPVLVKLACAKEENTSVISSAITAIATMERENAPPLLFGILWSAENPAAARYVVSALSTTGLGKEPLIRFCTELAQRKGDLNARINAAYALSSLGQLLGSAALASIADDPKVDIETRIKAVELIPRKSVPLRTDVLLQVALDAKQEKALRQRAIKALINSPNDEAAIQGLGKIALKTEDDEMQQIAMETLRKSGDKTALPVYAELARRGLNPKTRKSAIAMLAGIDDPAAVQGLHDVLLAPQEDPELRLQAFDALRSMQSPKVNEAFMALATAADDDWRLKLRAVDVLRQRDKGLGAASLNLTIQNLLVAGQENAATALRDTIAAARHSGAVVVAVEVLKSGQIQVDPAKMLRDMVLHIGRNYRSSAEELAVKNTAEALALLGDKTSAKIFVAHLLETKDYPMKKVMCIALGALADPAAIPALKQVALTPTEHADARRTAAHSICRIALAPSVQAMRALAPGLRDKTARQQARLFLDRREGYWVPPNAYNVMYYLCNMIGYDELRLPVAKALDAIWAGPARAALLEILQKTESDADQQMVLLFFHYGRFRKPEIVSMYEKLAVSAAGPATRYYAITALMTIGHAKSYDYMEDYLSDPEATYAYGKKAFMNYLKSAKRKSSIPALVACFDDPTAGTVTQAAALLSELTGRDFGPLPAPTPEAHEQTIRKWRQWLAKEGMTPRPRKAPATAKASPAVPPAKKAKPKTAPPAKKAKPAAPKAPAKAKAKSGAKKPASKAGKK